MNEGRKQDIMNAVEVVADSNKKMKQLMEAQDIDDAPEEIEELMYLFREDGRGPPPPEKEILEEAKKVASSGKFKLTGKEKKNAEDMLLSLLIQIIRPRSGGKLNIEDMKRNMDISQYTLLDGAKGKWEENKPMRDIIEQQINDLDSQSRKQAVKDILGDVERKINSDEVIERTPSELDVLELPDLDGLVKYFGSLNIRKGERREAIYNYWEKVEDKFDALETAYKTLIDLEDKIEDNDIEKLLQKLKENPPQQYVVSVKSLPMFTRKKQRWLDMLQQFAESLGYSATNSRGKRRRLSREDTDRDLDSSMAATTGYYPARKEGEEQGDLTADINVSNDPTVGMSAKEADQYINNLSDAEFQRLYGDIEQISESVEELEKQGELDPLLYFAYMDKRLKTSAFDFREIESINRKLNDAKADLIPVEEGKNVTKLSNAFEKMVDNFTEEASSARPRAYYALPMTTFIKGNFKTVAKDPNIDTRDIYETQDKQVVNDSEVGNVDFFKALNDLAFSVKESFGSEGNFETQGDRKLGTASASSAKERSVKTLSRKVYPAALSTPHMGGKPKQRELQNDLKEALENLVASMDGYFFEPSTKQFWPEDAKTRVVGIPAFKSIQRLKLESPTTRFMDRIQDESLSTVKANQINALADFTESIRNPRANRDAQELENKASAAYKTLNALFGSQDKKDNEVFITSLLYDAYVIFGMTDNNGVIKQKEFRKFPPTGGDIEKLSNDYKIGYSYPFQRLDFLTDNDSFKSVMVSGLSSDGKREHMSASIKRLRSALTKKEASMLLINETQLNIHDVLKKARGEEIFYGMLNQDNPDDISYIQKNVVDIPAVDVIGVVDSVSSYDRIGKNFGIPENKVYEIKGLFR